MCTQNCGGKPLILGFYTDCVEIVLTLKQRLKEKCVSKTYFIQIKKETNCNI